MKIQSNPQKIAHSQKTVYNFLCDPANYESLMPEGVTFSHTENTFRFQQKGMPLIAVQLKSKNPPEKIIWETEGGKIAFEFSVIVENISNSHANVIFIFEGEQLNTMLQMMIKKPLTNLLQTFAENLSKHLNVFCKL